MTDQACAVRGDRPRYAHDGRARLQTYLRQFPRYADVVVTVIDLRVMSANAANATAAQWTLVKEPHERRSDATVTLRQHTLA